MESGDGGERRMAPGFRRIWLAGFIAGGLLAGALVLWRGALGERYAPTIMVPGSPAKVLVDPDFSRRKVIRVLAVDGGGVRGMIPAQALAYLEHKTGRPTAELFDLFVGTSSGGIVSAACLMPGPDGKPRFTADEVVQSFERMGPKVFHPPMRYRLLTLDGVLAPKYSSEKKYEAFRDEFGLPPFGDLLKPTIITAYDMLGERPDMLINWQPEWANYSVPTVLNAGTTVSGVFNPVLLSAPDGKQHMYTDEGIIENDPAAVALEFLQAQAPNAQIIIVNLGTGRFLMNSKSSHPYSLGELRWISELLPYLESGNVQVTKRTMASQAKYSGAGRLVYVNINIDMPPGQFYHPFNASTENLAAIRALGEQCVKKNQSALDEVADLLVKTAQ